MKYIVTRKPNYLNLFNDFDQFLDDLWKTSPSRNVRVPSVDIQVNENGYVLDAELPGFNEKEIDVRVEDHILTIESSKAVETEKESDSGANNKKDGKHLKSEADSEKQRSNHPVNSSYLVRERNVTSFRRTFKLPEGVDEEKIQGEYRNGLLHLEIPKAQEKQRKKIDVKIA